MHVACLQVYRDERKLEKMERVARKSVGNPNPAHGGHSCQVGGPAESASAPAHTRLERTSVSLISADPLSAGSIGAGIAPKSLLTMVHADDGSLGKSNPAHSGGCCQIGPLDKSYVCTSCPGITYVQAPLGLCPYKLPWDHVCTCCLGIA